MFAQHFSARVVVVGALLLATAGRAEPKETGAFKCPKLPTRLTTAEVFKGRMEALKAGNVDLAFCYYDDKAVVVMPNTVLHGREQAKQGFIQFGSAFAGAIPQPTTVTIDGDYVLATFSLKTPTASIPDGADTFVIRNGRIQAQIVHANVVPASP